MPDPRHTASPPSAEQAYWDGEFARGRFLELAPDAFVGDILRAGAARGLVPGEGLYVGTGNGRNYLPLVAGGLDLIGLDISAVGLAAVADRAPERRHRLVHGSLDALSPDARYPVVIGIQVFQHGTRDAARGLLRAAAERVAPGGLFCVRVNAVGTDIARPHEVLGEHPDGGMTIRYRGSRTGDEAADRPGLAVHFYGRREIDELMRGFAWVMPPRLERRARAEGDGDGFWLRWEFIALRPGEAGR